MSSKFVNILFVTVHVTTLSVYTKLIPIMDTNILKTKLESTNDLTESLAESVCWDLEIYQNESSPFSVDQCMKNFKRPHHARDVIPPALQLQCVRKSMFGYSVEPPNYGGNPLVVLTPVNDTAIYLPYDLLMTKNYEFNSMDMISPGRYKSWITLLNHDGSHSAWRRGPDITTWNMTGEIRHKSYTINISMVHMIMNDTFKIKASIFWNSFDDEDTCFHIINVCDGRLSEKTISANMNRNYAVSDLPPDTECTVNVTGKYGVTRHIYRTPGCTDMNKHNREQCKDLEKVQNLTLEATAGGDETWDISVTWRHPRQHRPLRYNVTLFSPYLIKSLDLPGNATSATFLGIEGSGSYDVAVGAVHDKIGTVVTSKEGILPVLKTTSALSTVLGGSWSALLLLAAVLATLFLLWKRRADKHRNLYFSEPEDTLPKDGICEVIESESGAEDAWEVRVERLLLHEVVGEGAFGVVRRATLTPTGKEVAVKMLKDFPTVEEIRSFRAEMELMKSVGAHPHVVSLVGCCSGRRPFIVAEYCARGDLLSYLRCSWDVMVSKRNAKYYNNNIENSEYRNDLFKCKPQTEHFKLVVNKLYDLQGICDMELTTRDLLSFCRQIAMGMEFLASNRVVHRDLAARNVLVASDRTLKIADFGLSRDIYEENQYKQKGNGKMPMKWMALESLTHRIYTTQSDVWSFGVVMWEVASVGGSPYAGVAGARLPRLLRAGYRMPRPSHCPPQLYELMSACWQAHPRSRPTFGELHARLDELLNRACAGDYLRLDPDLDAAPPPHLPAHKYVRMIIRSKLGWTRGETYERPFRAVQSNHYSSPPASLVRAPVS